MSDQPTSIQQSSKKTSTYVPTNPPLSIPTATTNQLPPTVLSKQQIQIPKTSPQGGNNQLAIPLNQGNNQILIPNEGEQSGIDITAPWSRLNLKKLSEILDSTAERLLGKDLNGLLFIGVILKAAKGIIQTLAEEPIDKQKTGEQIFNRINSIIPNNLEKDKSFNWKDPNSGSDFRFVLSTEADIDGKKCFLRAYEEGGKEIYCISSLESQEKKFKFWRVEKNDFTKEQIDSLCKASYPRKKTKSLEQD